MDYKSTIRYKQLSTFFLIGIMSLMSFIFLLPLFYMFTTAFMEVQQIAKYPPKWIPQPWTLRSVRQVLETPLFWAFTRNTVFITSLSVIGVLFSSSFVAFGFACLDARPKRALFSILLATMMVPSTVTMIPTYMVYSKLGWLDTYLPLILPAYLGGGAFNIFLLRQFFSTIPKELGESARIDGCNWFRIYTDIYIPNAKTALIVVFMFSFVAAWGDYLGPLIYLVSPRKYTISIGITLFQNQFGLTDAGPIMAVSLLTVLPVLTMYMFGQKYFIEGIVTTGLKA